MNHQEILRAIHWSGLANAIDEHGLEAVRRSLSHRKNRANVAELARTLKKLGFTSQAPLEEFLAADHMPLSRPVLDEVIQGRVNGTATYYIEEPGGRGEVRAEGITIDSDGLPTASYRKGYKTFLTHAPETMRELARCGGAGEQPR